MRRGARVRWRNAGIPVRADDARQEASGTRYEEPWADEVGNPFTSTPHTSSCPPCLRGAKGDVRTGLEAHAPNDDDRERYLSVVATARNDDHGGNLLGRMRLFIEGLLAQCARFELPAELVLVDWNPPEGRPGLADALPWVAMARAAVESSAASGQPAAARVGQRNASPWCDVRVVEVPPHLHRRFRHAEALPLFQMIGKNAGIRRARTPFVLATNIDILFSNELMAFLALRRLDASRMYRIDRCDAAADVPVEGVTIDERLRFCETHLLRRATCEGTIDVRTNEFHRIYWDATWRVRLLEALQDCRLVPVVTRKRLHLNACGDFTLLHCDAWASLRGYPEFETYSMHLDSVLCTAAHFAGARERVLRDPMRIYHVEHGTGSGWTPEGHAKLNERLAKAGIPQLGHDEFHKWAVRMRRERKPMIFNEEDWGLAGEDLVERRPLDAGQAEPNAAAHQARTLAA